MKRYHSILLVDDDDITLFINKRIVSNAKVTEHLETRSNGREALIYLAECKKSKRPLPDLILMDVQMPELDAWGFLYGLASLKLNHPFHLVLLSGVLHPDHHHLCKRYKVDNYLLKPLTNKMFAELMEELKAEK